VQEIVDDSSLRSSMFDDGDSSLVCLTLGLPDAWLQALNLNDDSSLLSSTVDDGDSSLPSTVDQEEEVQSKVDAASAPSAAAAAAAADGGLHANC
jgi:hypothetical protein